MAIRARIKTKIKSLLFGSSTAPTTSINNTPQSVEKTTVEKTSFVPPIVSTNAEHSVEVEHKVEPDVKETNANGTPPTISEPPTETPSTAETTHQNTAIEGISSEPESNAEEATFIVEISELFPETCPHCGASSHNNWIRIENKFACGSCEAAY